MARWVHFLLIKYGTMGSFSFDKVWHDGLIFKLKQNGTSGTLLKLLQNNLIGKPESSLFICFMYFCPRTMTINSD